MNQDHAYDEARMLEWVGNSVNGLPDIGQFTPREKQALNRLVQRRLLTTTRERFGGIGAIKTHYHFVFTKENVEEAHRLIQESGRKEAMQHS